MKKMIHDDPVINEIRAVRRLISARFDHDPKKIVEYYIKLQEKYRQRLANLAEIEEEYQENALGAGVMAE
jgi:hypothetical protein